MAERNSSTSYTPTSAERDHHNKDNSLLRDIFRVAVPILALLFYGAFTPNFYAPFYLCCALILIHLNIYTRYSFTMIFPVRQSAAAAPAESSQSQVHSILVTEKNYCKQLFTFVLIVSSLSFFIQVSGFIVYLICNDLNFLNISTDILNDLGIFFTNQDQNLDGFTLFTTIMKQFFPNLIILIVIAAAKHFESKTIRKPKQVPFSAQPHSAFHILMNFVVLVILVSCQVFGNSLIGLGYSIFFLASQLVLITFKSISETLQASLITQFAIQAYCLLHACSMMIACTATLKNTLNDPSIGLNYLANLSSYFANNLFFATSLSCLFIGSVLHSQMINYQISTAKYKRLTSKNDEPIITQNQLQPSTSHLHTHHHSSHHSALRKIFHSRKILPFRFSTPANRQKRSSEIELSGSFFQESNPVADPIQITPFRESRTYNSSVNATPHVSAFRNSRIFNQPSTQSFRQSRSKHDTQFSSAFTSSSSASQQSPASQFPQQSGTRSQLHKRTPYKKKRTNRHEKSHTQPSFAKQIQMKLSYLTSAISSSEAQPGSLTPSRSRANAKTGDRRTKKQSKLRNLFLRLMAYLQVTSSKWMHNIKSVFGESMVPVRVLQGTLIFVTMRYPSYLSISLIIWIFINSFFKFTSHTKSLLIEVLVLPSLILTYATRFYASIEIQPNLNSKIGFIYQQYFWLECIILNSIIYLVFSYLLILRLLRKASSAITPPAPNQTPKPISFMRIVFACILKSSQKFALFLLFWIGFYTFNLIHLLLVVSFLIFSHNATRTVKILRKNKTYKMSFSFQYWYLLLCYLALIILSRFLYALSDSNFDEYGTVIAETKSELQTSFAQLIGINYNYGMPFSLSLTSTDFASLSLFWIAFAFATLQQDTYRSDIFQLDSQKILPLMSQYSLIAKYFPNFISMVSKCTVFLKNTILWLSFFAITTILLLLTYSFANMILLIVSYALIFTYLFKFKDPRQFAYRKHFMYWYMFNLAVIVYIVICYLLQFTALSFVQKYVIDTSSTAYQQFADNRQTFGFYNELPKDEALREMFLPIIGISYFAMFIQDYFKMISTAVESVELDNSSSSEFEPRSTSFRRFSMKPSHSLEAINMNFLRKRHLESKEIYKAYVLFDIITEVQLNSFQALLHLLANTLYLFNSFPTYSKGVDTILKTLQLLTIDIQNSLVFLFAMVFRLSVSMFIFILIYLRFYFSYYQELETFIEKNQINKGMRAFFKDFSRFFTHPVTLLDWKIKDPMTSKSRHPLAQREPTPPDTIEHKISEFVSTQERVKFREQLIIRDYSFIFSVICIALTYSSQLLLSGLLFPANSNTSLSIQWILFIFGTSSTSNTPILRNIYFYLLMLWVNILIIILNRIRDNHTLIAEADYNRDSLNSQSVNDAMSYRSSSSSSSAYIPNVSNSFRLSQFDDETTNRNSDLPTIQVSQFHSPSRNNSSSSSKSVKQQAENDNQFVAVIFLNPDIPTLSSVVLNKDHFSVPQLSQEQKANSIQQQPVKDNAWIFNNYLRIQYFYNLKRVYMIQKSKAGFLHILFPLYTLIMLYVSEKKQDLFSWIYLIAAFQGSSIREINRNTTILVMLQYFIMLLNINQMTSPLKIEQDLLDYRGMSFIENFIADQEILEYLAFTNDSDDASQTISFLLNSYVFFVIGFYFTGVRIILTSITRTLNQARSNIRNIYESKLFPSALNSIGNHPNNQLTPRPIWVNYQNWKNAAYRQTNAIYTLTIQFGYVGCAVIIMIIACQRLDIFNLVILLFTLIAFFVTEFIVAFPKMLAHKRSSLRILNCLQIYLYFVFAVYATMQIPYVERFSSTFGRFFEAQLLSLEIADKINIMFFILCTKLLLTSDDYYQIALSTRQSYILDASLMHKATSISHNDEVISSLLQNEKERRNLYQVVQKVTQTLQNWHKTPTMPASNPPPRHIASRKQSETIDLEMQDHHHHTTEGEEVEPPTKAIVADLRKQFKENSKEHKWNQKQLHNKSAENRRADGKIWLISLCRRIESNINPLFAMDTIQIADFIVSRNALTFPRVYINIEEVLSENLNSLMEYSHILAITQSCLFQVVSKAGIAFAFDNLNAIIKKATQCDNTSEQIHDRLVSLPLNTSTIMFYDRLQADIDRSLSANQALRSREFQKNLSHTCIYHAQTPIYLYNVHASSQLPLAMHTKLTLIVRIIRSLFMVAISQMHLISFFFLILYYFSNPALLSLPLLLLVFLNFLTERRVVMLRVWLISFAYVSLLIVFKYSIQVSGFGSSYSQVFFNGNLSMKYEAFLIFLIFSSQLISKKYGVDKRDPLNSENPHQSYVRNCINNLDFRADFINYSAPKHRRKSTRGNSSTGHSILSFSRKLLFRLNSLPTSFRKSSYNTNDPSSPSKSPTRKTSFRKQPIYNKDLPHPVKQDEPSSTYSQPSDSRSNSILQHPFESKPLVQTTVSSYSSNMHKQMLKDIEDKPELLQNQTKSPGFFIRVFSEFNKRPGRDFYPWIAVTQLIVLTYIFFFYTSMNALDTQGINEQLKYNQFSGEMVICLLIQVAFMVSERFLALRRDAHTQGDDATADESRFQTNEKDNLKSAISSLATSSDDDDDDDNSSSSENEALIEDEDEDDHENASVPPSSARRGGFRRTFQPVSSTKKKTLYSQQDDETSLNNDRTDFMRTRSESKPILQLSDVLKDEVLFAQLQTSSMNMNLSNYKIYGSRGNQATAKSKDQDEDQSDQDGDDEDEESRKNSNESAEQESPEMIARRKSSFSIDSKNTLKMELLEGSSSSNLDNLAQINEMEDEEQDIESQQPSIQIDTILEKSNVKPVSNILLLPSPLPPPPVSSALLRQSKQPSVDQQDDDQEEDEYSDISDEEELASAKKRRDRFLSTTEFLKYIQMGLYLIATSWFMFFYVPGTTFKQISTTSSSSSSSRNNMLTFTTNPYLYFFFFFSSTYVCLSTLQLRFGYKKLKQRNTIFQYKSTLGGTPNMLLHSSKQPLSMYSITGFLALVTRGVPFLQELKVILDWTVTKTSLTLVQWFVLEDIHFALVQAKIDSSDTITPRVGAPQSKILKLFMGFLFVLGILLLIFGPMLIFSTLNPIASLNVVTGGKMEMGIEFSLDSLTNYYPLFSNSNINNLQVVDRTCTAQASDPMVCPWESYNFESIDSVQTVNESQFQSFNLYPYSESIWDISHPSRNDMTEKLQAIISSNGDSNLKARIVTKLSLTRENTSYNSDPYVTYYPNSQLNPGEEFLSISQVNSFYNIFQECNAKPVMLERFYIFIFSSTTSNSSYKSDQIISYDSKDQVKYVEDVYIDMECFTDNGKTEQYWKMSLDSNMESGLDFFVLTDKYSDSVFGFSIITLYTSVILVIGKFIRIALAGDYEKLFLRCMPNPDELILLCEAIANARNERDLLQERLLYFELMDLARSPEVLKKLTGSYSRVLNEKFRLEVEQKVKDREFKKKLKEQRKQEQNQRKQSTNLLEDPHNTNQQHPSQEYISNHAP